MGAFFGIVVFAAMIAFVVWILKAHNEQQRQLELSVEQFALCTGWTFQKGTGTGDYQFSGTYSNGYGWELYYDADMASETSSPSVKLTLPHLMTKKLNLYLEDKQMVEFMCGPTGKKIVGFLQKYIKARNNALESVKLDWDLTDFKTVVLSGNEFSVWSADGDGHATIIGGLAKPSIEKVLSFSESPRSLNITQDGRGLQVRIKVNKLDLEALEAMHTYGQIWCDRLAA